MSNTSDVSKNLDDIADMAARLEARAIDLAHSADGPGGRILGGEAMVNLASSSNRYDWQRRIDEAERPDADGISHTVNVDHEDPDELWPPLTILRWWSDDYRQQLGMERDPAWQPTLVTEAAFLRNRDVAEWIWNNEVQWVDYAKDVARAKAKLENVLLEGERAERSEVVCDRCEDGRSLIKVYGSGDEGDRWKCMGCRHNFDDVELKDALAKQMRRKKPRDWVSRTEAIDLLCSMGHQRRTAAGLCDLPEAEGWRHDVTHVRFVSWPDVWRSHLLALQAARMREEKAKKAAAHKAMCEAEHGPDCWVDGRGCRIVCPRGQDCTWFLCPVHDGAEKASA